MDDAAGIHHRHQVTQRAGEIEVLFDHQDRRFGTLEFLESLDHVGNDRRRKALGGLVHQQQLPRLDNRACNRQHLLLAAREIAGQRVPEGLHRGKQPENPVEALRLRLAGARREKQVLANREPGENAHVLGHVGDAQLRDIRGLGLRDVAPIHADRSRGGVPQAHDGAQACGLAGAVSAQQHRQAAARHLEVHAMQNVVLGDVGVHIPQ